LALNTYLDIFVEDGQKQKATLSFRIKPLALAAAQTLPAAAKIEAVIDAIFASTGTPGDAKCEGYAVRVFEDAPGSSGGAGVSSISSAAKVRNSLDAIPGNWLFSIPGLNKAAVSFDPTNPNSISTVGAMWDAIRTALSDAAIKLGQDTTLSGIGATDAAAAMAQLAAAGFSVDDMTGGVTRGVLLLASATGTDVARAAAIAGDSFGAFRKNMGLTAADMPKIADLFVGAANVSSIGLEDIGESMKMVGPVAASMGITIEEVTAAIAALGNQGIKGGEAGTALRGVLASLVDPSKESAKLIKTLGLDFRDSAGKMKDFGGIAEELRTKTANLTPHLTNILSTLGLGLKVSTSLQEPRDCLTPDL